MKGMLGEGIEMEMKCGYSCCIQFLLAWRSCTSNGIMCTELTEDVLH